MKHSPLVELSSLTTCNEFSLSINKATFYFCFRHLCKKNSIKKDPTKHGKKLFGEVKQI